MVSIRIYALAAGIVVVLALIVLYISRKSDSGDSGGCRVVQTRSPNGQLVYASGRVCTRNAAARSVRCSDETRDRTHAYKWHETQERVFEHWPVEIYDESTGACRLAAQDSSDDARIFALNLVIDMPWTAAMREAHPFSPLTRQYVCRGEDGAKYRWDYENRRVVTLLPGIEPYDPSKLFVDTGAPCQNSALPLAETQWGLAENVLRFPDNEMPLLVAERFQRALYPNFIAWPRRDKTLGVIVFDVLDWSYKNHGYVIRHFVGDTPDRMPIGFSEDPSDKSIRLRGFGAQPASLRDAEGKDTYFVYTIASGRFDCIRFHDDPAANAKLMKKHTVCTSWDVLDLRGDITYCVAVPFMPREVTIGDKFAKLTPRGVEIFGKMYRERTWHIKASNQSPTTARITFNGRSDWSQVITFDPAKPYIIVRDGPLPDLTKPPTRDLA